MLVPFDTLPSSARLWIYQSSKAFTSVEKHILSEALSAFTETWAAHGNPMKASFQLPYDHFIILAADEQHSAASGCSIDDSVRIIKNVSEQLGLDFMDRSCIAFQKNNSVELIPINNLKTALAEGRWNESTLTFNNLITTKAQISEWLVPAGTTWLKRYLSPEAVAN